MMRKLFLLLLISTNCYAEPFQYDKPTVCDDLGSVLKMMSEYKEKIVFTGIPQGMTEGASSILLLENSNTGTWTILQHNEKFACIIAVGKNEKS
jgi:hypothetical protein